MATKKSIPKVRTSSQDIASTLARSIAQGELPPGTRLPPERELAAKYGVARNVVREALKRLEAVGAVQSWRGSGVYVQDVDFSLGIEFFTVFFLHDDGTINTDFLREVLEFATYLIRLVVRLASVRRTEEELQTIKRLVKEQEGYREDSEQLGAVTREIFRLFSQASHNRVCIALSKTLERISMQLLVMVDLPLVDFSQRTKTYDRLVEALEQKDSVMAELVVMRYIETIEKALMMDRQPQGLLHFAP